MYLNYSDLNIPQCTKPWVKPGNVTFPQVYDATFESHKSNILISFANSLPLLLAQNNAMFLMKISLKNLQLGWGEPQFTVLASAAQHPGFSPSTYLKSHRHVKAKQWDLVSVSRSMASTCEHAHFLPACVSADSDIRE